jgi:hypothetical protein
VTLYPIVILCVACRRPGHKSCEGAARNDLDHQMGIRAGAHMLDQLGRLTEMTVDKEMRPVALMHGFAQEDQLLKIVGGRAKAIDGVIRDGRFQRYEFVIM